MRSAILGFTWYNNGWLFLAMYVGNAEWFYSERYEIVTFFFFFLAVVR